MVCVVKANTAASRLLCAGLMLLAAGCRPPAAPDTASNVKPPGTAAEASRRITFSDLPVPPKPEVTAELLEHGKTVYNQNCAACHGVAGDGRAEAAAFLLPRPRNFIQANYRLRSTPSGQLPTDVDLFRSVSLGLPGTPMPPWKHMLSEEERWAVVEYLKTFSPRFSDTAETRDPLPALGTPPPRDTAAVVKGRELFTTLACVACHGESGRGNGPSAVSLVDDSQTRIKPRDFSNPATFKSGYSTKDIVRTILTGFNGTPMVGYHGAVAEEDAWKVAYYIETLAKRAPAAVARPSQNYLEREALGEPDVRIRLTERAWRFDPEVIRLKKGQVVEVTFEPTDNGLGVGHGFAVSGYDEVAFVNGAMVGVPKTVKFRADRAGTFTYYCATQCSTDKLHPLMNGTLVVEDL
jgi:mono/diheme cytochrome c family protein